MDYRLVYSQEIALMALVYWLEDWPEEGYDIFSEIEVAGWKWVKHVDPCGTSWEFQAELPDGVYFITYSNWMDKLKEVVNEKV